MFDWTAVSKLAIFQYGILGYWLQKTNLRRWRRKYGGKAQNSKQRGAKRIASKCINGIHRHTFRQLPHKVFTTVIMTHLLSMPKRPTLTSQFRVFDTVQQ